MLWVIATASIFVYEMDADIEVGICPILVPGGELKTCVLGPIGMRDLGSCRRFFLRYFTLWRTHAIWGYFGRSHVADRVNSSPIVIN